MRRPRAILAAAALLGACAAWADPPDPPPAPPGEAPPLERVTPPDAPPPSLRRTGWNASMETDDGVLLQGTLLEPEGTPAGCVVLLHMFARDREDWAILAPGIRRLGLGLYAPDLRGHGDSRTRRGEIYSYFDFLPPDFARMPSDVGAALDFLGPRRQIDPSRMALVGASVGASAALAWAADHAEDVRTLVLLSPRWDFRGLNVREAVPRAAAIPCLVLAGEAEEHLDQAREIAEALQAGNPETRLVTFPPVPQREDHGTALLSGEGRGDAVRAQILDWLRARLDLEPAE